VGQNKRKGDWIFNPNKLDCTLRNPNHFAKFYQNLTKKLPWKCLETHRQFDFTIGFMLWHRNGAAR